MSTEIKDTYNVVQTLLENHEHLRDDDKKLITNVWANQMSSVTLDYKSMRIEEFFKHFTYGSVATPESICRMRRMIQQKRPELQGKYHGQRRKNRKKIESERSK